MNWINKKIKEYIIKDVYKITTSANYVEVFKGGKVLMGNKEVSTLIRKRLVEEARMLKSTLLLTSIKDNRNYIAQQEAIKQGSGFNEALIATFLITVEDMKLINRLAALDLTNE